MRPFPLRVLGTALVFMSAMGLTLSVASPARAQESAAPAKEAPAADVERSLLTGPAELGTRSLLHPFRDGVQWNPADDVFDRLDIVRVPASTPSCRMDVFEL